jgi:uncharacterized membrane protein
MFDYWHGGWHMWWMATSWIIGLVLVAVFSWAWLRGTAFQPPSPQDQSPESILKRRYAQGEISTEEYERRLSGLRR